MDKKISIDPELVEKSNINLQVCALQHISTNLFRFLKNYNTGPQKSTKPLAARFARTAGSS